MIRLTFHGAAETVTGSKYLLEADGLGVLFDCGMFQGLKELRERNWLPFPYPPERIRAVVLSHAHIDHVGYLPRLVRDGFSGPVYATPATASLAELLLLDSAHNQEEDAAYANRKRITKHQPALPLYDTRHVKQAMKLVRTVHRQQWFEPAPGLAARFHDSGHLLGSSMMEAKITASGKDTTVLFSGDVGRYDAPLYHDPEPPPACDYLVCESTYGNRDHPSENVLDQLCEVVRDAVARGGMMVVASFAVGRAQQLIYLLQVLIAQGRIPAIPIFLDSPMATSGMNLYRYYAEEHDLSEGLAADPDFIFGIEHVRLARSVEESRKINAIKGPGVIISSSGMMVGGRILHHLRHRLPNRANTIVLGGFMAAGTRGRALQDGARWLRVLGADVPVRAEVVELSTLSGHADRGELLRWLEPLPAPKRTFLTHGELASAQAFAAMLEHQRGWNVEIPPMGASYEL